MMDQAANVNLGGVNKEVDYPSSRHPNSSSVPVLIRYRYLKTWMWCTLFLGTFVVSAISLKWPVIQIISHPFLQQNLQNKSISIIPNINETTSVAPSTMANIQSAKSDGMCTTKWYKSLHLEFGAFSVKNFFKVILLMDYNYTTTTKDGSYQCVFFHFDTHERLPPRPLTAIGGKNTYDPHKHTFCWECEVPREAVHPNATAIKFMVVSVSNSTDAVNVTICRDYTSSFSFFNSRIHLDTPTQSRSIRRTEPPKSATIAACTQTNHHDAEFPLWLNYHYKMGIEHFYIYDHAPSGRTRLHHHLKSYSEANLVTLVPWYIDQWDGYLFPPNGTERWITHQIWSQNDCIHRYGHLHSWMLLSDVDEYIFPMRKFRHFKQLLDTIPSHFCALQVLNYNFKGLSNQLATVAEERPKKHIHRERKVKERNNHSKNFVRPGLIYYFSVHEVTKPVNNAPVSYANFHTHARLQHYRGDPIPTDKLSDFVVDTNILPFVNQVNNSISSILTS